MAPPAGGGTESRNRGRRGERSDRAGVRGSGRNDSSRAERGSRRLRILRGSPGSVSRTPACCRAERWRISCESRTSSSPVAAICGATAGLARGGLLDDRRHTSNAREYLAATGYGGGPLYEDSPAVTDGELITAPAMAPLEFAYHIFRRLELFAPEVLEAWYGLFKTRRPDYFAALLQAVGESPPPDFPAARTAEP
ncbi:MAG: DJ-1/PfpI family protein [Gemmatimonadota bacterium]